jgi:hypothetical protein
MNDETRLIVRFQRGNAVGVIEAPIQPDGTTTAMSGWTVKIGPGDAARAAAEPFPKADFVEIIRLLREFIESSENSPPPSVRDRREGGQRL